MSVLILSNFVPRGMPSLSFPLTPKTGVVSTTLLQILYILCEEIHFLFLMGEIINKPVEHQQEL